MSLKVSELLKTYHQELPEKNNAEELLQIFKSYSWYKTEYDDFVSYDTKFTAEALSGENFIKKDSAVGRSKIIFLRTVAAQVNFMLDHNYTPHLVRVHDVQAVQYPIDHPNRSLFCYNVYTLMERLEGDLDRHAPIVSKTYWTAFAIQCASTEALAVLRMHLTPRDLKGRNIVWKKLDSSDKVRGEKLQDYEYWRYKIGGEDFYIPRLDYLVKFCDYSDWSPLSNQFDNIDRETANQCIDGWLVGKNTLEEARQLFVYPGSGHKILDVVIDEETLSIPFPNSFEISTKRIDEELKDFPMKKPAVGLF